MRVFLDNTSGSAMTTFELSGAGLPVGTGAGGGGGGGLSEIDDNAIAEGQTLPLNIIENYIHDGGTWRRLQGGTDNAAAPVAPQGAFVGGVVTDPVDAFVDGDISLLHFDLAGRLLVSSIEGVADTDDNSIASGQTTGLEINIPYIFNGTVWIRQEGGVDNAVAPATPQGQFVGGVVTDPVDVFVDGDISLLHFDLNGRLIVAGSNTIAGNRQIQTVETTVALAGSTTFNGTEHDNIDHEGFGISLTLIGGGTGTTVTVNFQQRDSGGATFRTAFTVNIVVAAGVTVDFDQVLSVTRQFGRVQLVNTTANALATTELISLRKPIA